MTNEVFGFAIALYVKACVQHIINGGSLIAFTCKVKTAVTNRVSVNTAGICQMTFHVCQSGWRGSGVVACVHGGNHITCGNLCTCTIGLVVEVAVGVFVYLRTVGFGVHHWGLSILGNLLCIERVGKFAAVLRYGQTVACFQRQGVACFNQLLGRRCACGVAAGSGFEAAVVDGVGNVACSYQFACIGYTWCSYFACDTRIRSQSNRAHTYFVRFRCAAVACYGYWAVSGSLNFGFGCFNGIVDVACTRITDIAHGDIARIGVNGRIATQNGFSRVYNVTKNLLCCIKLTAVNGIGAISTYFTSCHMFNLTLGICTAHCHLAAI